MRRSNLIFAETFSQNEMFKTSLVSSYAKEISQRHKFEPMRDVRMKIHKKTHIIKTFHKSYNLNNLTRISRFAIHLVVSRLDILISSLIN